MAKAADAADFPGRASVILSDRAFHLNLDDAWPNDSTGLPIADARNWGPRLRFSAPPRLIEQFYRERGGISRRRSCSMAPATFIT